MFLIYMNVQSHLDIHTDILGHYDTILWPWFDILIFWLWDLIRNPQSIDSFVTSTLRTNLLLKHQHLCFPWSNLLLKPLCCSLEEFAFEISSFPFGRICVWSIFVSSRIEKRNFEMWRSYGQDAQGIVREPILPQEHISFWCHLV